MKYKPLDKINYLSHPVILSEAKEPGINWQLIIDNEIQTSTTLYLAVYFSSVARCFAALNMTDTHHILSSWAKRRSRELIDNWQLIIDNEVQTDR